MSATLSLTLIMELSLLLHYPDKMNDNKKQISLMSLWSWWAEFSLFSAASAHANASSVTDSDGHRFVEDTTSAEHPSPGRDHPSGCRSPSLPGRLWPPDTDAACVSGSGCTILLKEDL